jgi:hypothetical protein
MKADNTKEWCALLCKEHGVKLEYFYARLEELKPASFDDAKKKMGKLLYDSWHNDYDAMWDDKAVCDLTI